MRLLRLYFRFAMAIVCLLAMHQTNAASLTGRTTDDSVCDLSPLTSYRLGTKTFVEAGTRHSDQIYTRLALRFITQNCKNNQVLILDSEDGDVFDAKYFKEVSNRLCTVADVAHIPTATAQYPNAFQIKCRILKIQEAANWLSSSEQEKSTEAMISEGAPKRAQSSSVPAQSNSSDCSKMNMSSIFFGRGDCK